MPAKAFVIRFPNGDFEYDLTATGRALPAVGETLRRKGLVWSVVSVTPDDLGHTVHVERVGAQKSE